MAEARKKSLNHRFLWLGAAILLVVLFFFIRNFTRERLPIRVGEVVRADLTSTVSTNGKVEPVTDYAAYSPIASTVKALYVHEGDKVSAGKLLLSLDDVNARSRLATALSGLQSAQASYDAVLKGGTQEERLSLDSDIIRAKVDRDQAQHDLKVLEQLQLTGASSASEVSAARIHLQNANNTLASLHQRQNSRYGQEDIDRAKAALADAQAAYAAAQQVMTQCNVHAPFDGTVYLIPVGETDFVEQGKPLLQMADLNHIRIRAYFDEPEIGKLQIGQPITINWDAKPGREWHGHIARVPSTIITYGTRNVGEVMITVDDSDGTLLPNTNVTVRVITAQDKAILSIPREALHSEGGKPYVYVVNGDRIHHTPVTIGTTNLTQAGILSGLQEHQVVALGTTNGTSLTNGAPIEVVR
jgi:HlyD family secretion protein